ncbi:unnamed protein product [Fusarium graminearum]|nr:unnamed protein product [Fusarium graminearum]
MDASTASAYDFTMDTVTAPIEHKGLTADERDSLEILASAHCEGFENGRDQDFRLEAWAQGFIAARALFSPQPSMISIPLTKVYQGRDIEDQLPSDHMEAAANFSGNQSLPLCRMGTSSQAVHSTFPGDTSEQEAPFIEDTEYKRSSDIEPIAPTAGNSLFSNGQAQSPGSPNSATEYPDSTNSFDEGDSTRPTTPSVTADSCPGVTTTPMDLST